MQGLAVPEDEQFALDGVAELQGQTLGRQEFSVNQDQGLWQGLVLGEEPGIVGIGLRLHIGLQAFQGFPDRARSKEGRVAEIGKVKKRGSGQHGRWAGMAH